MQQMIGQLVRYVIYCLFWIRAAPQSRAYGGFHNPRPKLYILSSGRVR
ncbi:hypothetical protein [secondary endosymbiont of Ctenarytaina eucalypti]|nr:hypothetical protein [secondary endosymbiont of Ctenarytaina eucalypti]